MRRLWLVRFNNSRRGYFLYHLKNVSYSTSSKCAQIYIEHVVEILLMDSVGGQFNISPIRSIELCNLIFEVSV